MKEHDHPYWKTGMLRPVPAHVKDEAGIRKHIEDEHEKLGLAKPKGKLHRVPITEAFSQFGKERNQ